MKYRILLAVLAVGLLPGRSFGDSAAPDFQPCFTSQQQAIMNLVQAMKDVQWMIAKNGGGQGTPTRPNPFKDKQRFEVPELKKEISPEYQLDQLRRQQEELLDDTSNQPEENKVDRKDHPDRTGGSGSAPPETAGKKSEKMPNQLPSEANAEAKSGSGEKEKSTAGKDGSGKKEPQTAETKSGSGEKEKSTAGKSGDLGGDKLLTADREKLARQAAITDKLEALGNDAKLTPELRKELRDAAAAGKAAAKALSVNDSDMARDLGIKTLAAIRRALMDLRSQGDRQAQAAGDDIRKTLNQAHRDAQHGDRTRMEAALNAASQQAAAGTRMQMSSGRFAHARRFHDITQRIDAFRRQWSTAPTAALEFLDDFDKMRHDVNAALRGTDAVGGLREALAHFRQLTGEFTYLTRGRSAATTDLRRVCEDLQITAEAIGEYGRELSGKTPSAVAPLDDRLEKFLSAGRDAPDGARQLADQLLSEASALLDSLTSARQVTVFNAEEVPSEYRSSVGRYFEKLSEAAAERSEKP